MGLNVQKGWQPVTKNGRGRAAFSSMGDAAYPELGSKAENGWLGDFIKGTYRDM